MKERQMEDKKNEIIKIQANGGQKEERNDKSEGNVDEV